MKAPSFPPDERPLRPATCQAYETPRFDGAVYDPALDDERLTRQLGRVFDVMQDGGWRTLREIASVTGDPESSVSAQLRHLRKKRFGAYVVEKRRRGTPDAGCFEYRLLVGEGARS